jgi:predicted component of type VI protein secretion system
VHGAEGLERILNDFFRVPVRVHQWQPHWMRLPEDARSRIGLRNAPVALGQSAVIGAKVWDCQTRFRVEIGPLTLEQYKRFLPGGESMKRLRDWVLNYVGYELSCEMHLVLEKDEVPPVKLGAPARWAGHRGSARAASTSPRATWCWVSPERPRPTPRARGIENPSNNAPIRSASNWARRGPHEESP